METTEKNNTEKNEAISLTPAEIEMIRIKREQEDLKKKEAETKKQLEREKSLKDIATRREKFVAGVTAQQNATEKFLSELNTNAVSHKYEITKRERTEQFILWEYKTGDKRDENFEKDVYFDETLTFEVFGIKVVGREDIKIEVKEYFKSEGYSLSSRRQVSQGFRMHKNYENRGIKSVKTIIEYVTDKIAKEDRKNVQENEKATAKELALKELTEKYPDAEITHDSKWTSTNYERGGGYSTDFYKVKFANGLAVKYTYSLEKAIQENEETGVKITYDGIESYGNIDFEEMVNVLSNLEAKK